MACDWCDNNDNYVISELHLRGKVHPKVKICVACSKETPIIAEPPVYPSAQTHITTSIATDNPNYTTS